MSHTSFADLDRHNRRRLIAASALNIAYSTAVLVVLYIVLAAAQHSGVGVVLRLVIGIGAFVGLLGWRVVRILDDEHPELRAAEALVFAFVALIVVFAYTYLSLSRSRPANFSERLDHIGAMYFTMTVIATVGFGDIVARTDAARLLVTLQILLDLAVIAGIARTIVFAARIGVRRREARGETDAPENSS